MILITLLLIMMGGGVLAWIAGAFDKSLPKWISLFALVTGLSMMVSFWIGSANTVDLTAGGAWMVTAKYDWIPQLGMSFHLGLDGISLIMTLLTLFLGAISVIVSWKEERNTGFYFFNLLWLLAGITGVFLALDMMVFYFFWEIMLIPMYFVIAIWGYEDRKYAGWKFFLFTQISGLMMLLAIIALYLIHGSKTGTYTFDYLELIKNVPGGQAAFWLMSGFLLAFFVKLPALPFHSWLPDAYTQAPPAGSVIIAALMSKTAAYGLIRFIIPLFPEAAKAFAVPALLIGGLSILYGAKLSYAQKSLKRLIAYSSFSHMGFILVGVFSFTALGLQGVMLQMVAHGLSIAALFIISEFVRERTGSFDLSEMGGFWKKMSNMGGFTIVFIMASVGLPGLANFVAEFLTLAGAWQFNIPMSVLATLGLIVSVNYSLRILQKVFHQKEYTANQSRLYDLTAREWIVMGSLTIAIVGLGFFPQKVVHTAQPAFDKILMASPDNNSSDQTMNRVIQLNTMHLAELNKKEVSHD
ncbi:MAG: NADH-quinone oxidoreductase subunit M [Chitinophagaceae bacterium]|nr:NADH-quinone oxidoreductase subunit M [Chitinophagaceae bacterium]